MRVSHSFLRALPNRTCSLCINSMRWVLVAKTNPMFHALVGFATVDRGLIVRASPVRHSLLVRKFAGENLDGARRLIRVRGGRENPARTRRGERDAGCHLSIAWISFGTWIVGIGPALARQISGRRP